MRGEGSFMRRLVSWLALGALASLVSFSFVRPALARPEDAPKAPAKDAPKAAKVDLNAATVEQLMELPGVGEVTAKKIVAGRPYKAIADLSAAGLGDALIAKLTPLVTVGKAGDKPALTSDPKLAAEAAKVSLNTGSVEQLATLPGVGDAISKKIVEGRPWKSVEELKKVGLSDAAVAKVKPLVTLKDIVWVNPRSKVFHRPDSRWYGKTKEGAYLLAADAEKDGYRAAGAADDAEEAKDEKVDLNSATVELLMELPGVGEATAKKIVAGRPYKTIADLSAAGLGDALIEKLTPLVTIGKVGPKGDAAGTK
jgi:competence protein ComEA